MKHLFWEKHRVLALLLCLLLLSSVFASCADRNDPDARETTAETDTDSVDVDVNGNARVSSGNEGFHYGDRTFTIFNGGNWDTKDYYVDPENYDKTNNVSTAVVTRNGRLSDQYGIEIAEILNNDQNSSDYSIAINSINAGDNQFDAISICCYDAVKLALDGYIYDLNDFDTIHTDREWWDQEMVRQCSLDGHLFWLQGDATTTDNDATHALVFNKKMFAENSEKLGDKSPYDYVRDGTWTIDTLFRLASCVGQDKDGNSKYDQDDIYGLAYVQTACYAFLNATGIRFGSVHDSEPLITCDFMSEKMADVWTKCVNMMQQNWSFNSQYGNPEFNSKQMFMNSQLLFEATYILGVQDYRAAAADFEFGILPYPKFDETQKEYISPFHSYGTPFLSIPISTKEPEKAAAVLDLLAYESMYTVTPAYYNITLEGKTARDNESLEMLNIIFTTKSYDFGFVCAWANWPTTLMRLWNNKTDSIVSRFEASRRAVEKAIDNQLTAYSDYENRMQ